MALTFGSAFEEIDIHQMTKAQALIAIDARLNNVQARLKGLFCKPSDFGYFAYAPTAIEWFIGIRIEFFP